MRITHALQCSCTFTFNFNISNYENYLFFCLWDLFKRSAFNHVAWYYWLYTLLSFQTTISIFSSYINWHNCLIEHCNITQSMLFVLPHAPYTVVIYYPLLCLSVPSGTCSDELSLRLFSSILYFSTETKTYCYKD